MSGAGEGPAAAPSPADVMTPAGLGLLDALLGIVRALTRDNPSGAVAVAGEMHRRALAVDPASPPARWLPLAAIIGQIADDVAAAGPVETPEPTGPANVLRFPSRPRVEDGGDDAA